MEKFYDAVITMDIDLDFPPKAFVAYKAENARQAQEHLNRLVSTINALHNQFDLPEVYPAYIHSCGWRSYEQYEKRARTDSRIYLFNLTAEE